ncbi:hypothetical protein SPHINGOAX6_70642 [Sphingomonas sp. AX6]|nr:hypothetical protein SPHINGOAX6_70642 [Sphingomonas sp. AX6]
MRQKGEGREKAEAFPFPQGIND